MEGRCVTTQITAAQDTNLFTGLEDHSVDQEEVVALVTVHGRLELVRAKDQISGEDYNFKCQNCNAEYVGETVRGLGTTLNY